MTQNLKLLISHGDKGGTGKSMAAALALDHFLATGAPVLLIEGDAGIPDLALRFRGSVPVTLVNLNRAGDAETSFNKLGNVLEAAAAANQHVVINVSFRQRCVKRAAAVLIIQNVDAAWDLRTFRGC